MSKHNWFLTTTTLTIALLSGCQTTAQPADSTSGGDATSRPSLAGSYLSDCVPNPQADGTTQYIQLAFELTASRWDLDYITNADAACTVPLVTVAIAGPYTLERPSSRVLGAWEATFGFDSKTVRPEVDGLRDYLNTLEPCGAMDFVTGSAGDVYATGCPALGQYPQASCSADYDLVLLDAEGLRFGARPADNNMCSPEQRPTAMSPLVSRRR